MTGINGTRRALFLLPSDRMGGAERIVRTTAVAAAKSKIFDQVEVFVLCWNRTGTLDDLEKYGNITLYYTGAKNERHGVWEMIRHMKRYRFLLVFSSSTHINGLASFMRQLGILKTERLVARESTVMFDRDFGLSGYIFRLLYCLYGRQDLIICQSHRMLKSLEKHTKGRLKHLLQTVPNPIDFERIVIGKSAPVPVEIEKIPSDRIKIVWCGRLSPVKSPERAVEVLRALHASGKKDMHLVVIGEGLLREKLETKIRSTGLCDFVTLVGYCPNPSGVMARCHFGLVTSDTEGFPNVVLEMLASGVQGVISTNCAGGLNEIMGVTVVHSKDINALAQAIVSYRSAFSPSEIQNSLRARSPMFFLDRIMNRRP